MSDTALLATLGTVCAALFGLLCGLLGYSGNKLITKMDQLYDRLDTHVAGLHTRINGIENRVTVIETRCKGRHNDPC